MDKTLLLVVIFLGAFSLFKTVMLIMVGLAMKPKVDENGNIITQDQAEKDDKTSPDEDDSDFWDNW
ncbi:hypothetical protein Si103_01317 [Streptococcus infantarius subsp. infantarius]|nr:hypothetical protein [Streptococcus infantarius subsp. infantarius]MCO4531865.1 hypothetical protein [Streptococcus infantarius subsp. infantarius]MCO4533619.1 hypothetical protein [Streptococcus infantarius subsp. infantarius]MCO4535769.1 hypothetical protein [Streptococcus infantarius subsp. infantarius]MCO4537315.1 hypothetical protein [Streptococcus infantarius subsp. infantarius]